MVTQYHSIVKKGIISLGEEWKANKKVKKIFSGEKMPLSLVNHGSKHVMNYKPDVYFVLRNNKKMIFEILESEERKQDIITADVIRSFLLENVESLWFVYPGTEKDKKRIMEAMVTISKGLVFKGVNEKEIPFNKSGTINIKKEHATTSKKVKDILIEKMKG